MSRQLRTLNGMRREMYLRATAPDTFPIPPRPEITERPLTDAEAREQLEHAFARTARRIETITAPMVDNETFNTCPECNTSWKDAAPTPGLLHRTRICEACRQRALRAMGGCPMSPSQCFVSDADFARHWEYRSAVVVAPVPYAGPDRRGGRFDRRVGPDRRAPRAHGRRMRLSDRRRTKA